ncbi:GAF domain-containing protein, partial [Candidatus Sumerlaeota bacterium]|nr:GAF domain-containing protein [Candidatus Sumerlaeota bacterium]
MKDRPDFIKLLQAAAITANEAANPEEAYQKCLDQICLSFGWPVGHVYLVSDPAGNLFPSAIWHLDDPAAFDPLRSLTMTLRLSRGETLPGRVWESGAPAWVRDLSTLAQSPRMNAAAKLGLRAGLGVPVLVRDEVVAVLEFFSYADDAVEPAMLEVMR